ncbi:NAD(P)-dependent oxidoreductase [Azospirillum sp. ST 5-10]|uniref:NAD(P)-dependent oxidoreductase n=1 Tax=unclassified Azospirillum TaxID=2630922 RepID=UPI003F49F0AC
MANTTERPRIGFIGLGLMGHGLARNLLEKGQDVTVLDRRREAVERLLAKGAREASGVAALAGACDVLILCVNTAEDVEALAFGADGVLAGAHPGLIVVDHTTTNPELVDRLAAGLAGKGARFVEAPLTRTPKHAEAGQVNALVGADEATLDAVRPVFACYAENVFHIGPVGHAIRLKLIHNYIAISNVAAYCEGLALAAKEGLDLKKLFDIISTAGANSGMFQLYAPAVLAGDFTPWYALHNAQKDVKYYARWAESVGFPTFLGETVHQLYALASASGHADGNVTSVIEVYERLTGVPARLPQ